MKIKSVVFDLDGVLVNSLDVMEISWNSVKEKYSVNQSFHSYAKYIGLPFLEILKKIGIEENQDDIRNDYFGFARKNINKIEQYKDSSKIFQILNNNGIATGIITSKNSKNTNLICKKFELFADEIITPDDVIKGKPNKDSGLEYLKRTGFKSNEVLYVGDMETDYIFSKNMGFNFLFANYGYAHNKSNQYDTIDNLMDIIQYLDLI
jgi:HAD superfamily hydrolase (TIGR01549 family)